MPVDPVVGRRANPFADEGDSTKDLWLAIQVGDSFELALVPTQRITVVNATKTIGGGGGGGGGGGRTFSIPFDAVPGAQIHLEFPAPITQADKEDLETFEVLLRQYGCLSTQDAKTVGVVDQKAVIGGNGGGDGTTTGSSTPLKQTTTAGSAPTPITTGLRRRMQLPRQDSGGRLVLIDDSTGEVVGEVDRTIDVQGDAAAEVAEDGSAEKSPVVVDWGSISQGLDNTPVVVKTVKPEEMENDWMLKGAHYLR